LNTILTQLVSNVLSTYFYNTEVVQTLYSTSHKLNVGPYGFTFLLQDILILLSYVHIENCLCVYAFAYLCMFVSLFVHICVYVIVSICAWPSICVYPLLFIFVWFFMSTFYVCITIAKTLCLWLLMCVCVFVQFTMHSSLFSLFL
jgi:hypothetical protein